MGSTKDLVRGTDVATVIIRDTELDSYLATRLTVKPDYGFPTEVSDYENLSKLSAARIKNSDRAPKRPRG
jgi:hypothetical protein